MAKAYPTKGNLIEGSPAEEATESPAFEKREEAVLAGKGGPATHAAKVNRSNQRAVKGANTPDAAILGSPNLGQG